MKAGILCLIKAIITSKVLANTLDCRGVCYAQWVLETDETKRESNNPRGWN